MNQRCVGWNGKKEEVEALRCGIYVSGKLEAMRKIPFQSMGIRKRALGGCCLIASLQTPE
jgi:hypothetical protein